MLARWRMHTYLLRQSLAFFQNDMAGRLAQTVMQTARASIGSHTSIRWSDEMFGYRSLLTLAVTLPVSAVSSKVTKSASV